MIMKRTHEKGYINILTEYEINHLLEKERRIIQIERLGTANLYICECVSIEDFNKHKNISIDEYKQLLKEAMYLKDQLLKETILRKLKYPNEKGKEYDQ